MDSSPTVSVGEVLFKGAGRANDVALAWGAHQLTYGELRSRVTALSGALQGAGLKPGDRVAVHLLNRGETFELYFACALAGLTLVPINFRLTARELGFVLEDSGARIVFTQESIAKTVSAAAGNVRTIVLGEDECGPEYAAMVSAGSQAEWCQPSEEHLLLFTSGTTGRPKAVRLTHLNIVWFIWQQVHCFELDRRSVSLVVAPTYNMAGISMFGIPTLLVGGTVVIQPSGGWRPRVLAELVDRWKVTHTIIFPSQFKALLDADRGEPIPFGSMRFVGTGGEHCSPEILGRFRRRWPHVRLSVGYGQTETGIVSVCVDDDLASHPSSIGRTVFGTSCRVLGPDHREVERNQTGELFVSGPGVSAGYWNAPDETKDNYVDGWFATGDLGYQDEDGFLYLTGRRKHIIISKAQNIYPAEVEHVLGAHDEIADVAVVGIPDDRWGEAVTAAVVRAAGSRLSASDVVAISQQALASYKKPQHVVFVTELPRNGAGKVDRAALAEHAISVVNGDG